MAKRLLDIIVLLAAMSILSIPFIIIWGMVSLSSSGPAIYWSRRAGLKGTFFMMPKFRTMRLDTPEVETEKLFNPEKYITPIGAFLRYTSLDEIPQFLSILKGDMSVVGPRPALHNQYELILRRKKLGIDVLKPGLTGWAQLNGRDNVSLKDKVRFDYEYLKRQSILFDIHIIVKTIGDVVKSKNVIH